MVESKLAEAPLGAEDSAAPADAEPEGALLPEAPLDLDAEAPAEPEGPLDVAEALAPDWEVEPTEAVLALEPDMMTGADSTAKLAVLTPLEILE